MKRDLDGRPWRTILELFCRNPRESALWAPSYPKKRSSLKNKNVLIAEEFFASAPRAIVTTQQRKPGLGEHILHVPFGIPNSVRRNSGINSFAASDLIYEIQFGLPLRAQAFRFLVQQKTGADTSSGSFNTRRISRR